MIARVSRARRGITLTEILIAILIMGVGLISLATLFPLGLLRLREASRSHRAGIAYEVAGDDTDTRALLYKPSFTQTWYWTLNGTQKVPRDPFVQDAVNGSTTNAIASNPSISNGRNTSTGLPLLQAGLPFCYDPLWRSITGVFPITPGGLADPTLDLQPGYVTGFADARFGSGIFAGSYPFLRDDPNPNGFTPPSAYGLQRLTNFIPWVDPTRIPGSLNYLYPFTGQNLGYVKAGFPQPVDLAGTVFASNDDIVFNAFSGGNSPGAFSPLVPDMSVGNTPQADYRFTWFVTGRQLDAGGNGLQFAGDIVVCDGRPFGYDTLPGQSFAAPAGETVVEAIFGYSAPLPSTSGPYFGTNKKTVLLRWPANQPDPPVRVGGWICDVTYEANVNAYSSRVPASLLATTFARCYWYQIGKRTDPQADTLIPGSGWRSMVLTITSPVRDGTLLDSTGLPYHLNVALVMPSVINVFPRAFEVAPVTVP
jgi:type II secretory pathway pseudopilin PulG